MCAYSVHTVSQVCALSKQTFVIDEVEHEVRTVCCKSDCPKGNFRCRGMVIEHLLSGMKHRDTTSEQSPCSPATHNCMWAVKIFNGSGMDDNFVQSSRRGGHQNRAHH